MTQNHEYFPTNLSGASTIQFGNSQKHLSVSTELERAAPVPASCFQLLLLTPGTGYLLQKV